MSKSVQGGKKSLAWNSVYLALDEQAANGFSRLAGPRARTADKPPPSNHGMLNRLLQGCLCGAPPGSIKVLLETQDAAGKWTIREVPRNLSAIMIENLPKRWANGDDFWEGAEVRYADLLSSLLQFCHTFCCTTSCFGFCKNTSFLTVCSQGSSNL